MLNNTIDNWSLITLPRDIEINKTLPEESQRMCIQGDSAIHRENVITSYIAAYNPATKSITTRNGSIYRLGKPSETYVEWCRDNGHYIPTIDQPFEDKGPPCAKT